MALYSDIDLRLRQHPTTKDILVLEDDYAVKIAIKNIVLTNFHEKRFNEKFGGNIRGYLFESLDTITLTVICQELASMINKYEPRVTNVDVVLDSYYENEAYITVSYFIIKLQIPSTVKVLVKNVR